MLRRTKGYLLLTLLVLTGLAGRMHTETLTGKERRQLVNELRNSRNNLRQSVWDLTDKQLSFLPEKGGLNIKECIYRIAAVDQLLNHQRTLILKQKGQPAVTSTFSAAILPVDRTALNYFVPGQLPQYPSAAEAWNSFMTNRTDLIKYARTTTGNVRSYKLNTAKGTMDLYELILLDCAVTDYYRMEINKIRMHPRFPQ